MKDRYNSFNNLPNPKGGHGKKKKKGTAIRPGSSLSDRNNILDPLSSAQPRVSKFQLEKQKRSPVKNAKVNRRDRLASRRMDSIASLTSKRQRDKDNKNESAVELHGFEFHECLEKQDSDASQDSIETQPRQKSPVIELDNDDEQHDESLELVNQVVDRIKTPNKTDRMKEPIPRKKKTQNFLPPRNHSAGLDLAFPKVNAPRQRSNVMEEIDDSSDDDTWRVKQNKKKINDLRKREKQKKELEWMQKQQKREQYGTDYENDGYTDDFDNEDLGVQQQQQQSGLKKGRRKRARSQSALKEKEDEDDYLKDDGGWIHRGDISQKRKPQRQQYPEQSMEMQQKRLFQRSKENVKKLGKSVKETVMDTATRALSTLKTPAKRYKKSSSYFLDEDTPSVTGSPPLGLRRSKRSSARKAQKVVDEVIELSSDEESDDDIPTLQHLTNCDNDAAIAASLNRELNHSSRNSRTRLEQEEFEHISKRTSPRTRSSDSKSFVECTRIAIGNYVYFENMKMSFVPNQQKQLFELDLDHEVKLQIDVEDIEEIHYYLPNRHELGTSSNSGGESDESEEENTGNELVDSSDDEADLKKSLSAQKKRIVIEEDEDEEEQSLKVVSSDTSGDMIEVDKDVEGIKSQVIALDDNSTDDGDALVHDSSQPTGTDAAKAESQESVQIVNKQQNRKLFLKSMCVDDSSDEEDPETFKHVPEENKKCNNDSSDTSAVEEHGSHAMGSEDQTMNSDQDEATKIARLIEGSPEFEKIVQNHPVREHENENELHASNPDDHLQDIAMNFEDKFEAAKSSTKEEIADDKSRDSNDHVETTSLAVKPDHVSKSIVEPTDEAEDDIRSHYYLILRAKPSKENGLTIFTSNRHYFRSMPKNTPTKSTQLAKRYIVIESNNQNDFENLITFLKEHDTIGMYFTNDNNRLRTHEKLEEEIVSLLNFKKPMTPICEEHETALVFPSTLLETELDSVASNLIEANGKIGQNHESMFTNVAIEEKAPNGKQKNHIITIRGEDYDRLAPGEFLNDTLIDFWISWLIHRMGNVSDQVHVFTTQFYTKLEQEGVESVVSWTAKKNIDIFEKKYVFVPVNKDIHWSLLVIVNPGNIVSDDKEEAWNQNLEHPYILFMDSLRAHKKGKLQKTLYKWLNAEAARLRKFNQKDPYAHLTCPVEIAHVPTQDNCWDCGVFVCRYAFAMLYLLESSFECKLADWRNPKFRREIIKQHITETEAFDFGMDDIARLREEMAILIQDLHRIYKQKIEEKKTKKKAKKQQIQMQQENNRVENHSIETHSNGDITAN